MATVDLKEIRNVSYVSKDFDGIKSDIIEFTKQNFPNDFQDFNEASGGMAILEMLAYVGDLLAFYIDRQANETFINRAVEEKNIIGLSKTLGRQPRLATPAVTELSVSAIFNDSSSAAEAFTLNKGTRVVTSFEPSVSFMLVEDVDFSLTANRSVVTDGTVVTASISGISAVAGELRTFVYTAGAAQPFLKLTMPDKDITEVISITSSDSNEWTQTDFLAQDTIFFGEDNDTSTSGTTPKVLKMKRVPRRYIVEVEPEGDTSVTFGSGKLTLEDSEIVPNPEDFVLPATVRGSASSFSPSTINAAQFLNTRSLGLAPANISLDIQYRYGGGINTNVGSNTLTYFRDINITYKTPNFRSISADVADNIERLLTVTNDVQATGGSERETLNEIRENASAYFAAQNRAVTLQDYQITTLSMPTAFGTVFRTFARKDPSNRLGVELLLISKNDNGQLTAPGGVLKNNVETFVKRFKSFSDSIKITDGKIIDIGVDFAIVPEPNINANEALLEAFFLLRREFDLSNSNFNDTIVLPDIISKIQSIDKIRSVAELKVRNITGTEDGRTYSNVTFKIEANTKSGIIRFPENSLWQVKFLDFDLTGRTL